MITLRPSGGLCNRMMAVDSAIKLCKDLKKDLKIHWYKNHYLNASFTEMFEPIQIEGFDLQFITTDKKEFLYSEKEFFKPKQRLYNLFLRIYQSFFFDKVINGYRIKGMYESGYNFHMLASNKHALISSWSKFIDGKINTELFKPIPHLQKVIDKIKGDYAENTIGIHIRRGDHKRAIALSPTEHFIHRMNEEIKKDNAVKFFLASDSDEDKKRLSEIFGDRLIISHMASGDRNSTEGMEYAVIDLFCLAHTNKIIGSFYSTFSLVASELYNIPFEEIKINNE